MPFEFDPSKSAANKDKHGIDFDEAQVLWDDDNRIEFDARSTDEQRFATVGRIGEKLWAAYFTMRGNTVRLISVRRARDSESKSYEDNLSSGT
jgi:uncharacterized DUF497 family protein